MRDYAVMQLYGPMASWGDIAVGELRGTWTRPSRSALIGLLSAALGVTRKDHSTLERMVGSYRFAVRVDRQGTLIQDFHTWQRPEPKRGVKYETRKEELEAEDIATGISRRDYCCDARYEVCMWTEGDAPPFSLQEIKEAIAHPRFVLYLGRKSCPLGLPIAVKIIQADSVCEAFERADRQQPKDFLAAIRRQPPLFFSDDCLHIGQIESRDTFTRRDVPLNRTAWQFTERQECFGGSPE
ncbi:type I-E CRISPR-associated protein Cas5/CasD [Desulfomonile tiedjei]|uniref:CRISPR-associated protein Cas5 n=1 Tax=Desulfomonile tiedjei (strain ATCC 49306 / DSM 6799 / DCB-1) TaxID=706587 RepID=I4CC94_DESTA|nr:type I-E CRISPR-associated protein Cas5/CasD [Desulfomonile tiedjei]AFM27185.1 CRISPR-associated protein Cas5 [Desulfomonile tiedjei DSM 6799]